MNAILLAVPANPQGGSQCRASAAAIPGVKPISILLGSAWKRRAAALCFCAIAMFTPASALIVAWDPNPESDIAGYQLSYGTSSGVHPNMTDAGLNTTASVTGLIEGTTYYFVVTARNQAGLESDPSAEISYQVPVTPATPVVVIPHTGWSLQYVNSEETNGYPATSAFDGDPNTFWHTAWRTAAPPPPHEIQINLGAVYSIHGFRYLPRQDNYQVGNITQYEFYASMDGSQWGNPVATGTFANSNDEKEVLFTTGNARYVRLRSLIGGAGNVAELNILHGAAVVVPPVNQAPVFAANPIIAVGTTESVAYTGQTLAGLATDADAGDTITYSKVSGPAWLVVASNGTLSGTPTAGTAGLNSFVVRATDSASATADAGLQITVTGLPLPWVTGEIGTGMLAGSATYNAGTFTQAGSGTFGRTSDNLRFTYQTLSGDGEIIAKVSFLQNTGSSSRVGVMIRDSLATNSRQMFMGLTSTNSYLRVCRTSTGGKTSTSSSRTGTVPNTWVRLVRSGSKITAYKSATGTSWTTVGSTTVTMATNCYIGLAVTSGSNTTLNTSQFSNVSVTP